MGKTETRRVIGYVRVSTDEQVIGPRAQLDALTKWCAANDAELVAVHTDEGVSGAADFERCPGLMLAIDALSSEGADVLLVAKRDRLARDVLKGALVERLVTRVGASIESADGAGNGTGPEAELMRGMLNVFAQYERQIIGMRTRAALGVLKREGVQLGGEALGWRRGDATDQNGRRIVQDVRAEADTVDRILVLRSEGLSLRAIATTLASEGRRTKRGGSWYASTVRAVIQRRAA